MKTLKDLRNNKNLKQEEVAKILDISNTYLSLLETGKRNPSDKLKEKMARLYNCNITDIFLAISLTKRKTSTKGGKK